MIAGLQQARQDLHAVTHEVCGDGVGLQMGHSIFLADIICRGEGIEITQEQMRAAAIAAGPKEQSLHLAHAHGLALVIQVGRVDRE